MIFELDIELYCSECNMRLEVEENYIDKKSIKVKPCKYCTHIQEFDVDQYLKFFGGGE